MDSLIAMLRAAGDPTRLRLLLLLRQAELTVSELVEIVGQSQPRVSPPSEAPDRGASDRPFQGRLLGLLPRRRTRAGGRARRRHRRHCPGA
ncbi:MAG: ArsR family transcriptional regulator [Rhizomicrobium sp.]